MALPFLLFVATPGEGHFFPLRAIAKELNSRGYDCTVLSTENFRSSVEGTGVKFIGYKGDADHAMSLDLEGFPKDGDPSNPIELQNFVTKDYLSILYLLKALTFSKS